MRVCVVAAILLVTANAQAGDEAAARAHYQSAQAYFDQAHFAEALREYEESYRLTPYPAILYREALCLEQLGRYGESADTLARYLESDPQTTRRAAVEASIARLRERARPTQAAPAPTQAASAPTPSEPIEPPAAVAPTPALVQAAPPAPRRSFLAPGLVLGGAAALAVVGAGLIGSVAGDYGSCARPCNDAAISSMQTRAYASYAMFAAAGALAVVDVVLFVRAARRGRR